MAASVLKPAHDYSPIASYTCIVDSGTVAVGDIVVSVGLVASASQQKLGPRKVRKAVGTTDFNKVLLVAKTAGNTSAGTNRITAAANCLVLATLTGASIGDPVYLADDGTASLTPSATNPRQIGSALSEEAYEFGAVAGTVYA